MTCPLDGTVFMAWQDLGGFSHGRRLDLKEEGPIASPWSMAQCPACHFPLYRESFTPQEIKELKRIVSSDRFKKESKRHSSYFALALIDEERKEKPFDIAWTYLQASWDVEEKEPAFYPVVAQKAISWFDRAAIGLKSDKEQKSKLQIALYLPVELNRRTAQFEEAGRRLAAITPEDLAGNSSLQSALVQQSKLIAAKESGPYGPPSH